MKNSAKNVLNNIIKVEKKKTNNNIISLYNVEK